MSSKLFHLQENITRYLSSLGVYNIGDQVQTTFGKGKIVSFRKNDYMFSIELKDGSKLYCQLFFLLSELWTSMEKSRKVYNSLHVTTPFGKGWIVDYCPSFRIYTIEMEKHKAFCQEKHIVLEMGETIGTSFGIGHIMKYRKHDQVYVIQLENEEIGYFRMEQLTSSWVKMLRDLSVLLPLTKNVQSLKKHHFMTSSSGQLLSLMDKHSKKVLSLVNDQKLLAKAEETHMMGMKEVTKLSNLVYKTKDKLSEIRKNSSAAKEASELLKRSKELVEEWGNISEAKSLVDSLKNEFEKQSKSEKGRKTLECAVQQLEKALQARDAKEILSSGILDSVNNSSSNHVENLISKSKEMVEKLQSDDMNQNVMELLNEVQSLLPNVTDAATAFLEDSEKYVAAASAENSKGHQFLKKASTYVTLAEKQGLCDITKSIKELNVQEWKQWGEKIAVDSSARAELASKIKDNCLDFLMAALPSVEVPPISGIKDRVEYSISNLDLSGFQVKKEKVEVVIGALDGGEVISMRATDIKADIHNFQWTFAQKYLPYLNGGGRADAVLHGGTIKFGFKIVKANENNQWVLKLSLASVVIRIDEALKLTIQGSWFSFVYNALVNIFEDLIKDYIVTTLECTMIDHAVELMDSLNNYLKAGSGSLYWPFLVQLTGLTIESLPEAEIWRGALPLPFQIGDYEVIFNENIDIGIKLDKSVRSRRPSIVGFSSEGGVMGYAEASGQVRMGDYIVAIQGLSIEKLSVAEVRKLLVQQTRPLNVRFHHPHDGKGKSKRNVKVLTLMFHDRQLGLKLRPRPLMETGAIVSGFIKGQDGKVGFAERDGRIRLGMILVSINTTTVMNESFDSILNTIRQNDRPISLGFCENSDFIAHLQDWPPAIHLSLENEKILLTGWKPTTSFAEKSKRAEKGHFLLGIQGKDLLSPFLPYEEVMVLLRKAIESKQTIELLFAKTKVVVVKDEEHEEEKENDLENHIIKQQDDANAEEDDAKEDDLIDSTTFPQVIYGEKPHEKRAYFMDTYTFALPEDDGGLLGIYFGKEEESGLVVVKDFLSGKGPGERCSILYPGLELLQVCGINLDPKTLGMEAIEKMISEAQAPYTLTVRDLNMFDKLEAIRM